MTDFLEQARAELLAEDAAAFEKRAKERATQLERAAEQARLSIPPTIEQEEARLAELLAQRDKLLEQRELARTNPAILDPDDALRVIRTEIGTLERSLAVRRRLAGKVAA
jgi:hypothetical protein